MTHFIRVTWPSLLVIAAVMLISGFLQTYLAVHSRQIIDFVIAAGLLLVGVGLMRIGRFIRLTTEYAMTSYYKEELEHMSDTILTVINTVVHDEFKNTPEDIRNEMIMKFWNGIESQVSEKREELDKILKELENTLNIEEE